MLKLWKVLTWWERCVVETYLWEIERAANGSIDGFLRWERERERVWVDENPNSLSDWDLRVWTLGIFFLLVIYSFFFFFKSGRNQYYLKIHVAITKPSTSLYVFLHHSHSIISSVVYCVTMSSFSFKGG